MRVVVVVAVIHAISTCAAAMTWSTCARETEECIVLGSTADQGALPTVLTDLLASNACVEVQDEGIKCASDKAWWSELAFGTRKHPPPSLATVSMAACAPTLTALQPPAGRSSQTVTGGMPMGTGFNGYQYATNIVVGKQYHATIPCAEMITGGPMEVSWGRTSFAEGVDPERSAELVLELDGSYDVSASWSRMKLPNDLSAVDDGAALPVSGTFGCCSSNGKTYVRTRVGERLSLGDSGRTVDTQVNLEGMGRAANSSHVCAMSCRSVYGPWPYAFGFVDTSVADASTAPPLVLVPAVAASTAGPDSVTVFVPEAMTVTVPTPVPVAASTVAGAAPDSVTVYVPTAVTVTVPTPVPVAASTVASVAPDPVTVYVPNAITVTVANPVPVAVDAVTTPTPVHATVPANGPIAVTTTAPVPVAVSPDPATVPTRGPITITVHSPRTPGAPNEIPSSNLEEASVSARMHSTTIALLIVVLMLVFLSLAIATLAYRKASMSAKGKDLNQSMQWDHGHGESAVDSSNVFPGSPALNPNTSGIARAQPVLHLSGCMSLDDDQEQESGRDSVISQPIFTSEAGTVSNV